jgi:FkbM family methyltransferase
MKIIRKIKEIYKILKKHPVTSGNEILGLYHYISFNLRNRVSNEIVYNWIEGIKFIAQKGDAGIVANIYFGLYEFEESIFLLHFVEKEDVFLDVGANVGHYSLLMSGLKKCRSIAIEPVPKTYCKLKKQVDLNNLNALIEIKNIGVSNEVSELFFSTDKGTMDRIVDENYKNAVSVHVETIDSIVKNNIPIAIKIDVEGYEKYVLDGASETLRNEHLKIVILELNQSGKKYGFDDHEIYLKIKDFGFEPYLYDLENRKLIKQESYNKNQFNTIFVRDPDFVTSRLANSRKIKIRNKLF